MPEGQSFSATRPTVVCCHLMLEMVFCSQASSVTSMLVSGGFTMSPPLGSCVVVVVVVVLEMVVDDVVVDFVVVGSVI